MVRLAPGQPRPSTTTRRADLPAQRPALRGDSSAAVLRAVLDHGPIARSNLARLAGLSAASVSNLAAGLLERGLVREVPEAAGPPGFGRPHVPLDLEIDRLGAIGVHVAVSHVTVALLDPRGRIVEGCELPHEGPSPAQVTAGIAEQVARLRAAHPERQVLGVGVAVGGWVDAEAGVVVDHPVLGWHDVPLQAPVAAATGLATFVEGHSRGLLRAEQLFGRHAERARRSAVHLFVGNVVDVAFSLDGRVHEGPRSASGRVGWLQDAVSGQGLLARAAALGVAARHEGELRVLAEDDDRLLELFTERSREIGRAVATLVDLFDPEVLMVFEPGFCWLPTVREALLAELAGLGGLADATDVVVPSSFAAASLAVAGGGIVLDRLYADPTSVTRVAATST
ncbi:ROK family transcriptional regulator [Nocardioides mangrovicus]|uniref:ROK family transcriptional regulator n=1 Tax=Nocardioides mangrovicus TaxID=2478913 RepID=A0A3L8P2N0_9ACTN|nr:ROK family transcriptional regulator [Nocardioides mangrovicus]RLV49222.1 ROK family transcriptional regulator [Nocardioides mangrovicus]